LQGWIVSLLLHLLSYAEQLIEGADETMNITEEIKQIGSCCNAYDLHSEGARFEFQWDTDNSVFFCGLFSPFGQIPA
jgi:hypothetical protein